MAEPALDDDAPVAMGAEGADAVPIAADADGANAALEVLRAAGAATRDPVRFHYAVALARRLQEAPAAVQPLLQARLQRALADCAAQLGPPAATQEDTCSDDTTAPPAGALAQLGLDIGHASDEDAGTADPRTLRSARRFRDAWSRMHADDTVERALVHGPRDAGPLNSHALVLRTLTLLRELSPDYLRRFVVQAEAMLWLEQGRGRLGLPATRARGARPAPRADAPDRDRFLPPT